MNVYEILERVYNPEKSVDDQVVFDNVTLYVLGRDLGDALSQVENASKVVGIHKVCPISELPDSKYRVVPAGEAVEPPFKTPAVNDLDDLEEVLEEVKNELVHEQGYAGAVKARDALSLVRRIRMELCSEARTESEAPHPMLCFQHGGSEACERSNEEHGFECPRCARTESLDPEVLGYVHGWCLERGAGTEFGLSEVPRSDEDGNATILYLFALQDRGIVERCLDDLDMWRVCTE